MNQQNMEYLKENLKYLGFGDRVNESLENSARQGQPEFAISFKAEVNKKDFEATLHFRKSGITDMYFFNSYVASLRHSDGNKLEQTFYLNKGKGVTAKEAFNLLEGRAVYKEMTNKAGESYSAWIQLDFDKKDKHNNHEVKQFHQNFGYDLKAAVSKFPIPDLKEAEKEKILLQSLQKGNIQSVTIEKEGTAHKMFIEANPKFKSLNLYDGQMKRVVKENLGQYQVQGHGQNKTLKQEPAGKREGCKMQNDASLLPKKRAGQQKGLGIS